VATQVDVVVGEEASVEEAQVEAAQVASEKEVKLNIKSYPAVLRVHHRQFLNFQWRLHQLLYAYHYRALLKRRNHSALGLLYAQSLCPGLDKVLS